MNVVDTLEPADLELVERVLAGDVNEFERLIDRYSGYVYTIVARHVHSEMVAELAHETFVQAYCSLSGFQGKNPLKNWLATIALRTCQNYWRTKYRNRETPASWLNKEQQHRVETLLAGYSNEGERLSVEQQRELHDTLLKVMEMLSPQERMVLSLVHFEERTVKETAELLDISAVNVKVTAFRARRKLRSHLTKLTEAGE